MKINKLEEEPFLIRCRKQNKWGFRDSNNKIILPPIYDYAENFSEGIAQVTLNGKRGYIDKKGNVAIPFVYDTACTFSEGLAKFMKLHGDGANKWRFIDKGGNVVIPPFYLLS